MRTAPLFLATLAVLAASGCTSATAGTPHAEITPTTSTAAPTAERSPVPLERSPIGSLADRIMVQVVRDNTEVTAAIASDAQIVLYAAMVCTNLESHASPAGLIGTIQGLHKVTGWSFADASFVAGAAVANRCNQHAHLVG
jgi:hypothetical protein